MIKTIKTNPHILVPICFRMLEEAEHQAIN